MDRDVNPGIVERDLDEIPVERESLDEGASTDRDALQGGGRPVERQGAPEGGDVDREAQRADEGGTERENLGGGQVERDSLQAGTPRVDTHSDRTGGYGYDRPAPITTGRDMDASSGRAGGEDRGARDEPALGTDRTRGTGDVNNMARDW
jgi:hypothetical protein